MGNFDQKVNKFIEIFVEQNGYAKVIQGLQNTLLIAVTGLIIGIIVGTLIATVRVLPKYKTLPKVLNGICSFYVALFRGTPMVVQLLVFYYVLLPIIGLKITGVQVAMLVFGLNSGAYISEIMRSGIQSVDSGQMEAGRAVGLSFGTSMMKIVIPQAVKNILPTLGNEFISLIKETSVVSFVGAADLYVAFNYIGSNSYEFMVPYLVMALIYIALVLIILMILIGGERGAVSLMTLAGNIVILFISILLMSIGFPALLLILAAGAGVCYNSLFYQNGNNPKTRAAFLATLLVMLLLFIPIYLIIWRSGSYGLNELQLSEDDFMYYYSTDIHINMLHVAVFVTVFSTLGAVIDTALSVTSSVYEVWTHKNSLTAKELTSSGYQVGKEIIGTTVNTLLFAYLGGSILLFAYVQTQQYNLEIILNSKFLFQDVAIMLSGAIACLFTVPVSIRCVIRQIHHAASETDHS